MPEHFLWTNLFKKRAAQQKTLTDILKQIPIFSDLNARQIGKVEGICHDRFYKEGEKIFSEGEPGTAMYIIKSGEVKIYKTNNGADVHIATLAPGDFFGELALLDDAPRSAMAMTSVPSEIMGIDRNALNDLVTRDTWLGTSVMSRLAQMIGLRLKEASEKLKKHSE